MSDTTQAPSARPPRLAAALLGGQVVAIVGFSVFYVVELARGLGEDRGRAGMSVVVFLIGAAGLAALALALWRGRRWPRTPTVLWNVLLLPVASSLVTSDQLVLGILLGAIALACIAGVLATRPAHPTPAERATSSG